MFDHHVMFRLKAEKRGELPTLVAKLRQLKEDVPSILEVRVVINQKKSPKGWDVYYYARFADEAGFEAYMSHPKHVPVVQYVGEICDGIADVDAMI